jgi:hypothetical protein
MVPCDNLGLADARRNETKRFLERLSPKKRAGQGKRFSVAAKWLSGSDAAEARPDDGRPGATYILAYGRERKAVSESG